MTLRLHLGSSLAFCASALPKGPAMSNDTIAKFTAVRRTPTPATCPVVPAS